MLGVSGYLVCPDVQTAETHLKTQQHLHQTKGTIPHPKSFPVAAKAPASQLKNSRGPFQSVQLAHDSERSQDSKEEMLPVCQKFVDAFLQASSSGVQNMVPGNEKLLQKTCKDEMDALLDTAIKTHDGELAERVVKYVGNVNAKSGGVYVLHWAAETGDLKIVKLLLDGGAKLEPKTHYDDTPLHWAAGKGHLEIVEELVKRGAKVNRKNGDGMTPLHLAAQRDRVNVVKYLLANGADVNVKTGMFSGKKAYDVAATDEIKELVKPKK